MVDQGRDDIHLKKRATIPNPEHRCFGGKNPFYRYNDTEARPKVSFKSQVGVLAFDKRKDRDLRSNVRHLGRTTLNVDLFVRNGWRNKHVLNYMIEEVLDGFPCVRSLTLDEISSSIVSEDISDLDS